MGRSTDNPNPHKISVRLDEKTKDILEKHCKQKTVTQTEGTRPGIRKLENDLKK